MPLIKRSKTSLSIPLIERIRYRPAPMVRWGLYAVLVLGFIGSEYEAQFKLFFPLVFAGPVLVATWWDERPVGYSLGALSMLPWFFLHSWYQFATRALALIVLIELVGTTMDLIKRVRLLEGLLPICSHCHRIRTIKDQWVRLEEYIQDNSEALFTHGICPSCMHKKYPDEA